jgi:hypothetical protein
MSSDPQPIDVEIWLMRNGFRLDYVKAQYEYTLPNSVLYAVTVEEIVNNPANTVRSVELVLNRACCFYQSWNWDDEVTRKIDISDPSKKDGKVDPTWCNHEWIEYIGLNQKDFYCKKCNIVKGKS